MPMIIYGSNYARSRIFHSSASFLLVVNFYQSIITANTNTLQFCWSFTLPGVVIANSWLLYWMKLLSHIKMMLMLSLPNW